MEKMLQNWYNTYTSCKYPRQKRKWFVALNSKGRPQLAKRSRRKHKTAQFLVLHLDDQNQPGGVGKQSELRHLAVPTGKTFGFSSVQQRWFERQKAQRHQLVRLQPSPSGHNRGRRTFAWRNATLTEPL